MYWTTNTESVQRFVVSGGKYELVLSMEHGDEMQIEIRSPFKIHFSTFMRRLACFLSTELFYIIPIVHFSLHAKIPGWPASLHPNIDESEDLPPHLVLTCTLHHNIYRLYAGSDQF